MLNNYYEDKPVGFTSIPAQKKGLGVVDNTYIEFGKGVVNPDDGGESGGDK
ncbi:MAG: hypothetical protein J6X18_16160 [Bacteroidales bacterium]|nr:hypothetical protein [Bacteroidales bacterium]